MLPHIGDHEIHKVEVRTGPGGRSSPGLPRIITVVDGIDHDIASEPQILLGHHTRRLIRRDADVPPGR